MTNAGQAPSKSSIIASLVSTVVLVVLVWWLLPVALPVLLVAAGALLLVIGIRQPAELAKARLILIVGGVACVVLGVLAAVIPWLELK